MIDLYLRLPGKPERAGKADWKEARAHYRRGVPFEVVEADLVESLARRLLREKPPSGRVRTLHYFRGGIAEAFRNQPIDPACVAHLRRRLETADSPGRAVQNGGVGERR